MKIAFFTDTFHPTMDGVVRTVDEYKHSLEDMGHEVKVFAPDPGLQEAKRDGVSYARTIGFSPYPQYRIPYWWSRCVKDATEFKPDIIHSHAMVLMGLAAKEAAKKTGTPLVGTFHTMLPQAGHYISEVEGVRLWFENASWKYLQWFYSGGFSKIICPSQYVKGKIGKYGIEAQVLPNPVDVEKFNRTNARPVAKKWFGKNTVLFLGRVAKEKNIDFLLEVARLEEFEELDANILVAGDGPYLASIKKKANEYGITDKVLFAGKVEDCLLPSFYSLASCCLFPSEFETQGLTALESLACSTPVVALENTAIAEFIVDGKNGQICRKNPLSAVEALDMAIKNKKKMEGEARKTAMRYSVEKCTHRLVEIYESALQGE